MLDSIRKKKDNFIYSILILAVVAVMAFYTGSQSGKDKASDAMAASVNGDVIGMREFQAELQSQMARYQSMLGGQYNEQLLSALQVPQRTLEGLIQRRLLYQNARKLDIYVSDKELGDYIRAIPYFQKNGRFDAELYSRIPNRGLEEKKQREALITSKFQNYLTGRILVPPAEQRTAFILKESKIDLEYAKIDFNKLAPAFHKTATELETEAKTLGEKSLEDYYQSHKKDYLRKGTQHLRRIRVGIPFQATPSARQQAKKKIEEISDQLKKEPFDTVAKTKSDDEYAKKGGDIGWVDLGSQEPQVEKALETLADNQISSPIETPFGYFIVQRMEKKPESTIPFAEVRLKIVEKQLFEKHKKDFADKTRKQFEDLLAKGQPLTPELKKHKIELKKTGAFSIGQGFIPQIGQVDSILDAAFELTKQNPVAKKLYFYQDHYYYIRLHSAEPAKMADYAKNAESVERTLATSIENEVLSTWLSDLQKNATIKKSGAFDRTEPEAS